MTTCKERGERAHTTLTDGSILRGPLALLRGRQEGHARQASLSTVRRVSVGALGDSDAGRRPALA